MTVTLISRARKSTRLRVVAGLALLLLLAWAAIDLAVVTIGAEDDRAGRADVILVLGCKAYENDRPTECIRARASHAALLYHQGLAPRIIASGGPSQHGPAEAGVMADLLREAGVPSTDIIQEDRSHNTVQNIANSQAIMRDHGWRTALLVTEPYHIKRATIIAHDAGLPVLPSPATAGPDWQNPWTRPVKLVEDALKLMYYQVKAAVGVKV